MDLAQPLLELSLLLSVAVAVGVLAQRVRLPLSVVLAAVGFAASSLGGRLRLEEQLAGEGFEEILVFVFLPVLVFQAVLGTAVRSFFANLGSILALAVIALEALRVVADHEREIVVDPTAKGEVSQALNGRLPPPYLRDCRPCAATHIYEMPFRLAALHAGLELEAGTSPPVLRRFDAAPPRFGHLAAEADPRLDVLRGYLRFFGPARMKDAATFVDMPLAEVRAHWPPDAVEVDVADAPAAKRSEARFVLAADVDALADGGGGADGPVVRLLGPYDPYLQLRDRELLVPDAARRRALWPVLGRPGAVLVDGEVAGSWRPRTAGRALTVRLEPWRSLTGVERRLVGDQAERLADHRGVALAGVVDDG